MADRVNPMIFVDIPATDPEAMSAFYEELFGWQVMEMPEMGYTIVSTGPSGDQGPTEAGYIGGGMLARQQAATSGSVIVIDVDSIDETLQRIDGMGGSTVVGRTPVGDMGFAAYFTDPEGNVVGLWETARQT